MMGKRTALLPVRLQWCQLGYEYVMYYMQSGHGAVEDAMEKSVCFLVEYGG